MNPRQVRLVPSALLVCGMCLVLLQSGCGNGLQAPTEPETGDSNGPLIEKVNTAPSKVAGPAASKTPPKDSVGQTTTAGPQASPPGTLVYPRDKDRLMATVHGRKVVLEDIINHIEARHFAGFKVLIALPAGQREIQIPRMANWTGQYADILTLEAEARRLGIKEAEIRKRQGEAYLAAFRAYQLDYQKRNRQAFPSTKTGLEFHRKAFQKDRGLGLEVEGLLNTMIPDKLDKAGVVSFYKRYSETMNGYLKISQIFVNTRDRKTGALFVGDRMAKAQLKIREISKLLNKNGKNFELIATSHSEDATSAGLGGVLNNLHRFDPRMPASFCRASWSLRNGQWKGPIETMFGSHFVKRIEWMNTKMIVNPDPNNKDIRHFVRSHRKEQLIFKLRENSKLTLHY